MSTKGNGQATSVDQLIEATVQAREVIREAHEALKDLRRERAEARREAKELSAAILAEINEAADRVSGYMATEVAALPDRLAKGWQELWNFWDDALARGCVACLGCGQVMAIPPLLDGRATCPVCGAHRDLTANMDWHRQKEPIRDVNKP
jgi:hypothetical protein